MTSDRQAIDEQAATWLQKRDGGEWSAEDQERFSHWLRANTHHRVAFLRLEAAWREMGRLQAVGAGYPRGKVPSIEELDAALRPGSRAPESRQGRRRRTGPWLWITLAACLTALIVGGAFISTRLSRGSVDSYSTAIGGLAAVPLQDGSNVTLSSATVLRARFADTQRRIDLAQGEAFFEVAKDPTRAFVVDAGAGRVVAVGTKFAVRRDGGELRVVVTDGTVRFESAAANQVLPAGTIARFNRDNVVVQTASLSDAQALLSWRSGYVVFHETTLADAIAEFNRYNERKIVVEDPRIAAVRVTGKFRSTNIGSFTRLLEQSFPVRASETSERIVLSATESKSP